jgi:hypothetical protein
LIWKHDRKERYRPRGEIGRGCGDNVKINFKEIVCDSIDWVYVAEKFFGSREASFLARLCFVE